MLTVVPAVLLALLDTDPDGPSWARPWIEQTLRSNLPGYIGPDGGQGPTAEHLRGWSVGATWGAETLVQSRPIVRGRGVDPVDDLLRTPASSVLATFCVTDPSGPGLVAPTPSKLSRFRRWLGVREGAALPPEHAAELRRGLPGFVARHQVDRSDGELVFLRFLSNLHAMGGLGKRYSPPDKIRDALAQTIEQLDELGVEGSHNMMVCDGRTFAMLHRSGTLLSFVPPPPVEPPPSDRRRSGPHAAVGSSLRAQRRRTNLLLCSDAPADDAPRAGAERIAPGVLSIDVRDPRALHRA